MCRNGHVREGDIEIGDDDDEFFSQRTLRIPTQSSQQGTPTNNKGEDVLYGAKASKLYMQSLQFLLQKQIKWLVDDKSVPQELESVVKSLWAVYVNVTDFAREESRSSRATSLRSDDEQQQEFPSFHSRHYFSAEYIHTISLCYLGCVFLKLPIYLYDFHRWSYRCEFPYISGMYYLPKKYMKKLSFIHQKLLRPDVPSMTMLQRCTQLVVWYFFTTAEIQFPCPSVEPLAMKIIRDFLLPPELYPAVLRLSQYIGLSLKLEPSRKMSAQKFGELGLMGVVVVCIKLIYGLDELTRIPTTNTEPAAHVMDWELWLDLVRKFWLQEEIYPIMDERDVYYWGPGRIDRYLNWFHEMLGESVERTGQNASRTKMYNMFPIGVYNDEGKVVKDTEVNEESSVDKEKCLNDIIVLTQGTTKKFEFHGDLETIQQAGVTLTPGARYRVFTEIAELPEFLNTVYEVAGKMCGLRDSEIRKYVKWVEEILNRQPMGRGRRKERDVNIDGNEGHENNVGLDKDLEDDNEDE